MLCCCLWKTTTKKGGPKAALVSMTGVENYSTKSPAVRVNSPLSLMTKSAVVLPLTSARTIVVLVAMSCDQVTVLATVAVV